MIQQQKSLEKGKDNGNDKQIQIQQAPVIRK